MTWPTRSRRRSAPGPSPPPLALLLLRNPAQWPDGVLLDLLLAEAEAQRPEQREPAAVTGAVDPKVPRDAVPAGSAAPNELCST